MLLASIHNGFSRERYGRCQPTQVPPGAILWYLVAYAPFLFSIRVVIGFSLDALQRPCTRSPPLYYSRTGFFFCIYALGPVSCPCRSSYSCCAPRLNGGTLVRTGSMEGSFPSLVITGWASVAGSMNCIRVSTLSCLSAGKAPGWMLASTD